MSRRRTQDATTTDGVTIGGTVHGAGSRWCFLQGIISDGDIDWQALAAHLTGRFTCHLPSRRGRSLSSDHPDLSYGRLVDDDLSYGRLVDDILTYVDSIGEPVGLIGWSGGAGLALTAAARSRQVTAKHHRLADVPQGSLLRRARRCGRTDSGRGTAADAAHREDAPVQVSSRTRGLGRATRPGLCVNPADQMS